MKVMVANRGEIAIRIFRTCSEMGISTVAVYTDSDEVALHLRYADDAIPIGPSQNYMNIPTLIKVAQRTGANAIHPGYGFLAESAEFARAVEDAGLIFIGPRPQTIALMGDKLAARRIAREAGLPVLAGPDVPLPKELPLDVAHRIKYPILVKATAGGGGRGIFLARSPEELDEMVAAARQESKAVFGDDTVYLEPMVMQARHIEVQVLGDGRGKILCLGDRECSIQRRRQKLIEEAPAPGLDEDMRQQIHEAALSLATALEFRSLGTVEFLIDVEGNFFFIEVNPRIQVEHTVTEAISGIDLVREQLLLALTGGLHLDQEDIKLAGAAIEARVLAEDVEQGFIPATGDVTYLKEPGGLGIRVDSSLYAGMPVRANYDSLLAKVIANGADRSVAISRLRRALGEYQIGGVSTDLEFLLQVIDSPQFISGSFDTTYLDHFEPQSPENLENLAREIAAAAALYVHNQQISYEKTKVPQQYDQWQMTAWREQMRAAI
ncbi:MAG: ATP-grasp domain-containing protein [Anaerolineaceae bacterium]|nr:ATP-grasp domain-containing protein [Anaerolineaceae bacterium]